MNVCRSNPYRHSELCSMEVLKGLQMLFPLYFRPHEHEQRVRSEFLVYLSVDICPIIRTDNKIVKRLHTDNITSIYYIIAIAIYANTFVGRVCVRMSAAHRPETQSKAHMHACELSLSLSRCASLRFCRTPHFRLSTYIADRKYTQIFWEHDVENR